MDVGVSIANVWGKAKRFPERCTRMISVNGHQSAPALCPSQQRGSEHAADAVSPIRRPDIKTPHPQGVRYYRFDCEPANTGEQAFLTRCEQNLALAIKARCPRHPVNREPLDKPIALGARLCPQGIEAGGQLMDHMLKLWRLIVISHSVL